MARETDLLQRFIHGLFGAFVGAAVAFGVAWYFDSHVLMFVVVGAAICFLYAFVYGDYALDKIIRLGWWT